MMVHGYGYIYKHTSPSGKSYIGQTTRNLPELRWNKGRGYLRNCKYLAKAIKKYGWKNFTHEILWEGEFSNIEELNQLEEDYIIKFNTLSPNGYNLLSRGTNHLLSNETKLRLSLYERTQESNQKRSNTLKGRISPRRGVKLTEEHKAKLKGNSGWKTVFHHTEEAKDKIRKAALNRPPLSLEIRKKMSESHKGVSHSLPEEAKIKISLARKGVKLSHENRRRISEGHKGLKWFNNGKISICRFECPDGFKPGRLPFSTKNLKIGVN